MNSVRRKRQSGKKIKKMRRSGKTTGGGIGGDKDESIEILCSDRMWLRPCAGEILHHGSSVLMEFTPFEVPVQGQCKLEIYNIIGNRSKSPS